MSCPRPLICKRRRRKTYRRAGMLPPYRGKLRWNRKDQRRWRRSRISVPCRKAEAMCGLHRLSSTDRLRRNQNNTQVDCPEFRPPLRLDRRGKVRSSATAFLRRDFAEAPRQSVNSAQEIRKGQMVLSTPSCRGSSFFLSLPTAPDPQAGLADAAAKTGNLLQ